MNFNGGQEEERGREKRNEECISSVIEKATLVPVENPSIYIYIRTYTYIYPVENLLKVSSRGTERGGGSQTRGKHFCGEIWRRGGGDFHPLQIARPIDSIGNPRRFFISIVIFLLKVERNLRSLCHREVFRETFLQSIFSFLKRSRFRAISYKVYLERLVK